MSRKILLKYCFIWTFIFGIATHGFCFFNTLFNHDSTLIYLSDDEWKASLGRYVTPIYRIFRSRYSAPWLTGILALSFLSLCAYLLIQIFDITKQSILVCICGLLATNYSFIFTNAFCIHDTDSYMFAILLTVTSAFALTALKAPVFIRIIISGLTLAASLGIYQAFATLPFALILIYIIMQLLDGKDFPSNIRLIVETIASYICAAVMYVVGLKIYTSVTNISLSDSGHNSITGVFSFENWHLFSGIANTYRLFFDYFFQLGKFNRLLMIPLNSILILALLVMIIATIIAKKVTAVQSIIICLILLVFPPVLGALSILSTDIGHLMKFQYFTVYLLIMLVFDFAITHEVITNNLIAKSVSIVSAVMIFYIVYNSIAFANGLYLSKNLEYQSSRELFTRVIEEIENQDGYDVGNTEVLFIGSPYTSEFYNNPRTGYGQMGGSGIAGLELYSSVTGYYTYYDFIKEIINEPMEIGSSEEASAMAFDSQVISMPSYPANGSIAMVNDKVIVKFSDMPIP